MSLKRTFKVHHCLMGPVTVSSLSRPLATIIARGKARQWKVAKDLHVLVCNYVYSYLKYIITSIMYCTMYIHTYIVTNLLGVL